MIMEDIFIILWIGLLVAAVGSKALIIVRAFSESFAWGVLSFLPLLNLIFIFKFFSKVKIPFIINITATVIILIVGSSY